MHDTYDSGSEGFSLVELLLVVAIIGIVAAILIPAVKGKALRERDRRSRQVQVVEPQPYREYIPPKVEPKPEPAPVKPEVQLQSNPRSSSRTGSSPKPLKGNPMLTYDEFYALAGSPKNWGGWGKPDTPRHSLEITWTIGGMTGGSCWNEGADHAMTAEPEPEFEALDTLLEKVCPEISFLTYKKLLGLIQVSQDTRSEYYGNYYIEAKKSMPLKELYGFLKERNLLNPPSIQEEP